MRLFFGFVFLFILVNSCGTIQQQGYGHLMEVKEQKPKRAFDLYVDFRFYRESQQISKLYYEIHPKLFLKKFDSLGFALSDLSIELEVRPNQYGSKILFEAKKDYLLQDSTFVVDSMEFDLAFDKTVYYELKVIDNNKHTFHLSYGFWERSAGFIPEDMLLVNKKSNEVLINPYIFNLEIDFKDVDPNQQFGMNNYTAYQEPAKPMYELKDNPLFRTVKNDSVFIGTIADMKRVINACKEETYFRMKPVSAERIGSFDFTKVLFENKLTIEPLIYLLRDESVTYNAWVKFWTEASANNPVKLEKLLEEFNRRVEYANLHFSSHKLGWKTDRGMAYILFGAPDRKDDDVRAEIWSYGFTNTVMREFVFVRNPVGLHKNDFVLERNLGYRELEESGIQRWKNGWIRYGI